MSQVMVKTESGKEVPLEDSAATKQRAEADEAPADIVDDGGAPAATEQQTQADQEGQSAEEQKAPEPVVEDMHQDARSDMYKRRREALETARLAKEADLAGQEGEAQPAAAEAAQQTQQAAPQQKVVVLIDGQQTELTAEEITNLVRNKSKYEAGDKLLSDLSALQRNMKQDSDPGKPQPTPAPAKQQKADAPTNTADVVTALQLSSPEEAGPMLEKFVESRVRQAADPSEIARQVRTETLATDTINELDAFVKGPGREALAKSPGLTADFMNSLLAEMVEDVRSNSATEEEIAALKAAGAQAVVKTHAGLRAMGLQARNPIDLAKSAHAAVYARVGLPLTPTPATPKPVVLSEQRTQRAQQVLSQPSAKQRASQPFGAPAPQDRNTVRQARIDKERASRIFG